MKYLKKFNENNGIDYLKLISKIASGEQLKFFQWQISNAKEVIMSPIPKGIKLGTPKSKECYKNAFKIVDENWDKDILYVEGLIMMHGIPIDHAWNKIGDIYFDITANITGIKHEEYTSIIELPADKIWEYANDSGTYGGYLAQAFLDN